MTWQLRPNSPSTHRLVRILQVAGRPMTKEALAAAVGMKVDSVKRHMCAARVAGQVALLGNGTIGTAWATPEVAAVARAEAVAAKRVRDEAKRAARRALQRQAHPKVQTTDDGGKPLRVQRSSWPSLVAAPAPPSVFHLGLDLERRVCTYCLREGHLARACPRREQER